MASQQTPNYRLSRWAGTDRILVEEFNDNWDKIDTALKGNADKAAALQTALAGAGNCEIGMISYTGTGKSGDSNPTTVTFPKMPAGFFLCGAETPDAPYLPLNAAEPLQQGFLLRPLPDLPPLGTAAVFCFLCHCFLLFTASRCPNAGRCPPRTRSSGT